MKAIKLIVSIILVIGGMLVFNESDTFTPNLIGLACFALLVVVNIDKDTLDKIQNK